MIRTKVTSLVLMTTMIGSPLRADVTVNGNPVQETRMGTLLVRQIDCRALTRHHPREDVAYEPGKGASGEPVPPADLEPPLNLTDRAGNVSFAVTVDLEDRLGKGGEGQPRPFDGEGYIGYVEVRDGRAYWEGQALDRDGLAAVSEACRKARLEKDEKDR